MPVWCTKRSLPASSGVMNPKPFSSLNHFTVPVAMCSLPGDVCGRNAGDTRQPRRTLALLRRADSPARCAQSSFGGVVCGERRPPVIVRSLLTSASPVDPVAYGLFIAATPTARADGPNPGRSRARRRSPAGLLIRRRLRAVGWSGTHLSGGGSRLECCFARDQRQWDCAGGAVAARRAARRDPG